MPGTHYDTIIRNGTIYDGEGRESFVGDIAVRKDRIEKTGTLTNASAKKVIDAAGLIVAPGFIDPHTHCDLTFIRAGYKRHLARFLPSFKGNYNFISQGVTSCITGNCGEGYGDINTWKSLIAKTGFGTNLFHLIPHGQVRLDLFGHDQKGSLKVDQMGRMIHCFRDQMHKGAIGFSSGVEYFPGFESPTGEFVELAEVVAESGGIYATHTRENSGRKTSDGEYGVTAAALEAIEIGERGGAAVHLSHIKINRPFNDITVNDLLEPIEAARRRGVRVTADLYPYEAGSSTLTLLLPRHFVSSGGVKEVYRAGAGKAALKEAVKEIFTWMEPERTVISVMYKGPKKYEGKSIADIARSEERNPVDVYADLLTRGRGRVPTVLYFRQEMSFVRQLAALDYVIPGSDGLTIPFGWAQPHPRAYGTFPRMIRNFVLDEKVKTLPSMIQSMTSRPADIFGLKDRGRIAEGCFADITIFNPGTIRDRSTWSEPHQYAEGIEYVLVNGTIALAEGCPTGKRGGVFG